MDTSVAQSITVDRDLFDRFLAWQREQEQEQQQEAAPPAVEQPPGPPNVGTMDAHGFVPTTMHVPTREGGMYGVPEVPDTTEQAEQADPGDPGDQQQAPYTSPVQAAAPTTPGKRAPRMSPDTADTFVLGAMKSHPRGTSFTIRPPRYAQRGVLPVHSVGLTDDPKTGAQGAVADHLGAGGVWATYLAAGGSSLSVSQVRAALARLVERGCVYAHGKNGKQDRWFVHHNEFVDNH